MTLTKRTENSKAAMTIVGSSMRLSDRRLLDRSNKYLIAFKSFDSRGAGHHFMKLRALLETPSAKSVMYPVQTRDALIDYFRRHKIVHRIATVCAWQAAT